MVRLPRGVDGNIYISIASGMTEIVSPASSPLFTLVNGLSGGACASPGKDGNGVGARLIPISGVDAGNRIVGGNSASALASFKILFMTCAAGTAPSAKA